MNDASLTAKVNEGWIRTFLGGRFSFDNPSPADVEIRDIAHSLSLQCRYNGHVPRFYSVAQHSLLVEEIAAMGGYGWNLAALLHDAAEAYVGDMVSPLKRRLPAYQREEASVNRVIGIHFDMHPGFEDMPGVKVADQLALAVEAKVLFGIDPADWGFDESWPWEQYVDLLTECWPPELAEVAFFDRYIELSGARR